MNDEEFVDMEYVRNNPNKPWNLNWLSCNENLTVKDVNTFNFPDSGGKWNWYGISRDINIQEVRDNPNESWNKHWLSHNKQLTVKDIETLVLPNSEDDWNWNFISEYISIREVINNPTKPWERIGLLHNKGCTRKILEFFDAGLLRHLQKNIPKFQYHTDMSIKCEH